MEQPRPLPRKPRVRTTSEGTSDLHGGLEQKFNQMDVGSGDARLEMQWLNEQVAESRQEEQRLREVISQLQHQQSSLQSVGNERGATEAVLKQKERELNEWERDFQLRQERFRSEVSDKEFSLRNRELELQRLEDELNARKKEMDLAKFDEEQGGVSSSEQLAKLADKEIHLQKQEEHLQRKEFDLQQWALNLDRQAKENQQRLMEIEQREGSTHVTTTFPVVGHTQPQPQPHPQWGGEPTRQLDFTTPVDTTYYQQPSAGEGYQQHSNQQWYTSHSPAPPPTRPTTAYTPYTAHQGVTGAVGANPTTSSPGYQHQHQQQFSHQQQQRQLREPPPTDQFQNLNLYQHQPPQQLSPHSSPVVAGTSQVQFTGGMQSPSGSSVNQLHPDPSVSPPLASVPGHSHSGGRILFSIGGQGGSERNLGDLGGIGSNNFVRENGGSEMNLRIGCISSSGGQGGSERNLGTSSSSVASTASSENYLPGRSGGVSMGGATGYSRMLDESEECARALQWEENTKAKVQVDADLELARSLQEEYDAEARSTQQTAHSADQLLALQLQQEDLKEELSVTPGGPEVPDVVKKVLDERMTRQHQLKEQEEVDRRIAESMSSNNLGDHEVQANLQNNFS